MPQLFFKASTQSHNAGSSSNRCDDDLRYERVQYNPNEGKMTEEANVTTISKFIFRVPWEHPENEKHFEASVFILIGGARETMASNCFDLCQVL